MEGESDLMKMLMQSEPTDANIQRPLEDPSLVQTAAYSQASLGYGPGHYTSMQQPMPTLSPQQQSSSFHSMAPSHMIPRSPNNGIMQQDLDLVLQQQYQHQQSTYGSGNYQGHTGGYQSQRCMSQTHGANMTPYQGGFPPETRYPTGGGNQNLGEYNSSNQTMQLAGPASLGLANLSAMSNQQYYSEAFGVNQPVSPIHKQIQPSGGFLQPSGIPYSVGSQQSQSFPPTSYSSRTSISSLQNQLQGFNPGGSYASRATAGTAVPSMSYQSPNSPFQSQHSPGGLPMRSSTSPVPQQDAGIYSRPQEPFQKIRSPFATNQSRAQQQPLSQSSCMFVQPASTPPQLHYQAQQLMPNTKSGSLSKRRASYPGPHNRPRPHNRAVPSPPPKRSPPSKTPSPNPRSPEQAVAALPRGLQHGSEDSGSSFAAVKNEKTSSVVSTWNPSVTSLETSGAVDSAAVALKRNASAGTKSCDGSIVGQKGLGKSKKLPMSPPALKKCDLKQGIGEYGLKTDDLVKVTDKSSPMPVDMNSFLESESQASDHHPKKHFDDEGQHEKSLVECKKSDSEDHNPLKNTGKRVDGESNSDVLKTYDSSNEQKMSEITKLDSGVDKKEMFKTYDNDKESIRGTTMNAQNVVAENVTSNTQQLTQNKNAMVKTSASASKVKLSLTKTEELPRKETTGSVKEEMEKEEKASDTSYNNEVQEIDLYSSVNNVSYANGKNDNKTNEKPEKNCSASSESREETVSSCKETSFLEEETGMSDKKNESWNGSSDNTGRVEEVAGLTTPNSRIADQDPDKSSVFTEERKNHHCSDNDLPEKSERSNEKEVGDVSKEENPEPAGKSTNCTASKQEAGEDEAGNSDQLHSVNDGGDRLPDSVKANEEHAKKDRKETVLSLRCDERLSLDDDERLPVEGSESLPPVTDTHRKEENRTSETATSSVAKTDSRTRGIQTTQQGTTAHRSAQQQASPIKATIIAKGKSAQSNQQVVVAKTTNGQMYLIQGNVLVPVQSLSSTANSGKQGSKVIIVNTTKAALAQPGSAGLKSDDSKQIDKASVGTAEKPSCQAIEGIATKQDDQIGSHQPKGVHIREQGTQSSVANMETKPKAQSNIQGYHGNQPTGKDRDRKRPENVAKSEVSTKRSKASPLIDFLPEENTHTANEKRCNSTESLPLDFKNSDKEEKEPSLVQANSTQTNQVPVKRPGRGRPAGSKDKQKRKSYVHKRQKNREGIDEKLNSSPSENTSRKKFSKTASAVKEMSVVLSPVKRHFNVPTVNATKPSKKRRMSTPGSPVKQILTRPRGGVDGDSWVCSLCGKPSNQNFLGDLFGPYKAKISRERSDIVSKDCKSPQKQSLPNLKSCGGDVQVEDEGCDVELWIHRDCGVWSPGVFILGRTLHGLEQAVESAVLHKCTNCSEVGATLVCFRRGCNKMFHYACARDSGCSFAEENYTIFCSTHKG